MISEEEGARLLRRRFESAGLAIAENHPLRVGGKTIFLDGFDPVRKIGFEYITTEAGDRAELTADIVAELESHMRAGHYFILLIDETEVTEPKTLEQAADHFLRVALARSKGP